MTEIRHEVTASDRAAMRAMRAKLAAEPIRITRASYDALIEQTPPADSVAYSEGEVGGVPGVWCTPEAHGDAAALLYLHGGVFVFGSARGYRHFVGQIAARAGVRAFAADYRRAPEHPFPAALDDARAAYRGLTAQVGANRVALVGDSAGGGLALSLLQDEAGARCGVLLSPWTDLALTGATIESNAPVDPVLSRAALDAGATQYLGQGDPKDPRASPLYGRTRGAPSIQVHVGTAEILLDDSLRLATQDRVEVHAWEDMPHVFPSHIGLFEAAGGALGLMAAFLRKELA
jgi:monoterpene epsilon-lactone hydrolase